MSVSLITVSVISSGRLHLRHIDACCSLPTRNSTTKSMHAQGYEPARAAARHSPMREDKSESAALPLLSPHHMEQGRRLRAALPRG